MSWRKRAGIAIVVLALLGGIAQLSLRWAVSRSLAGFVHGQVRIQGSSQWFPMEHSLMLDDLWIEQDNGDTIQAKRISVKINPNAFLRRNLVVDAAIVEGLVLTRPTLRESLSESSPPQNTIGVPDFPVAAWAIALGESCDKRTRLAVDERKHVGTQLQRQLERLKQRFEALADTAQNPLRNREALEETRREWVALRQSSAEERVRMREADNDLRHDLSKEYDDWRSQLVHAVTSSLPERESAVRQTLNDFVHRFLRTHQPILQLVTASALPIEQETLPWQGTDVALPGLEPSFALVRSARLDGTISIPDQAPIPFRGKVSHWGDTHRSNPLPHGEWHFEIPLHPAARVLAVTVERLALDGATNSTRIAIRLQEESQPDALPPQQIILERSVDGDALALDLLYPGPIEPAGTGLLESAWTQSLREAVEGRGPLRVHGTFRLATYEFHPSTLATLDSIWDEAQANYLDRVQSEAAPIVQQRLAQASHRRDQAWAQASDAQRGVLEDIERETDRMKPLLDRSESASQRMARKP
jgi:hypothetical protein